jgi:hypothetical protein
MTQQRLQSLRRSSLPFFILALILMPARVAMPTTLLVDVRPRPPVMPAEPWSPEALIAGAKLQSEHIGTTWKYVVVSGEGLVVRVDLSLAPLPDGYALQALAVELPFYERDASINFPLAPIKTDAGAAEVRDLYGTDVKKQTDQGLLELYQRARVIALRRMSELNDQWSDLTDYTVQAVFKYLEIVAQLASLTYVLPPDDVIQARDWLAAASSQQGARVAHAIRGNDVALLKEIDALESIRLTRLWQRITEAPCERRYGLLKLYDQALAIIPVQRQELVKSATKVYRGNILSAMAQCLAAGIASRSMSVEAPATAINDLLGQIDAELPTTKDQALAARLRSDRIVLKQLLLTLPKQAATPSSKTARGGALPARLGPRERGAGRHAA